MFTSAGNCIGKKRMAKHCSTRPGRLSLGHQLRSTSRLLQMLGGQWAGMGSVHFVFNPRGLGQSCPNVEGSAEAELNVGLLLSFRLSMPAICLDTNGAKLKWHLGPTDHIVV